MERKRIITGGFPCQDVSIAKTHGKALGVYGKRSGLWIEYWRLIDEVRPDWGIGENVEAIFHRGLDVILRDLAEIGYDAEWYVIPASAVGSPQQRNRVWILFYPMGNPNSPRLQGLREHLRRASQSTPWQAGKIFRGKDGISRLCPPGVPLVGSGIRSAMERIRTTGNTVVPQIPEALGYAILEWEKNHI